MTRGTPHYLIFDLDGTLINSLPDLTTALNLLRREMELPVLQQDQVGAMVGDGVSLLVRRALGEKLYSDQRLERFMTLYDQHLLDQTACYPGITEFLEHHDPALLALVTNKPIAFTRRILDGLNLAGHFTAVIGGDSYQHKKPDPYPLQQAMRQIAADPERTVMIGDHHNDLQAARAAGIANCFCGYGFGQAGDLVPDYYAARPADLLTLFPGSLLD
ncbi:MAG: HAD-IA family hydrolase [Pelovirga sp.]|jgi:phosphoglycolate phosphatase